MPTKSRMGIAAACPHVDYNIRTQRPEYEEPDAARVARDLAGSFSWAKYGM